MSNKPQPKPTLWQRVSGFFNSKNKIAAWILTILAGAIGGWLSNGFGIPALVSSIRQSHREDAEKQEKAEQSNNRVITEITHRVSAAKVHWQLRHANKTLAILNGKDSDAGGDAGLMNEPLASLLDALSKTTYKWRGVDSARVVSLAATASEANFDELFHLLDTAFPIQGNTQK